MLTIPTAWQKNTSHWLGKLRFHAIHARNSTIDEKPAGKGHPMANELAAPVTSLLGAYSTQTDVNNLHLVRYLPSMPDKGNAYCSTDRYQKGEEELFPMNWVISEASLRRMDEQLQKHPGIDAFKQMLAGGTP